MRFAAALVTGVAAISIAACGSKTNNARSASTTRASAANNNGTLAFRYPWCQTTDNDWDVTAAALQQAGTDASYDSSAGSDAGVLANDLRQLASEASSANESSTALIYSTAATLFQGDAAMLPSTGQTPADNGGYINAAGTQLQADCSLASFQPSESIEGATSGQSTGQSAPSQSRSATTPTTTSSSSAQSSAPQSSSSGVSCSASAQNAGEIQAEGASCATATTVVQTWSSTKGCVPSDSYGNGPPTAACSIAGFECLAALVQGRDEFGVDCKANGAAVKFDWAP